MDWLCFQEMGVGLAVFREGGEVTYSYLISLMDWRCFQEMGVGLAVFREGGEVTYYNLWLPARFPLLYVYVARKGDEEKLSASFMYY